MKYQSKILIVDDDENVRKSLTTLLSYENYEIFTASDGMGAIVKVFETNPDVVLLDIEMSGIDGFDVCSHLRNDPKFSEIPIIMITGLNDKESRLRGIKAGVDDFISKPFDADELIAKINTISQIGRYRNINLERKKLEWAISNSDNGYLIINQKDEIIYLNGQAKNYLYLNGNEQAYKTDSFINIATRSYACEPMESWEDWKSSSSVKNNIPLFLIRAETKDANAFYLEAQVMELSANSETNWIVRLRDVSSEIGLRSESVKLNHLIAHKLNTPLSIASLSLELLSEDPIISANKELSEIVENGLAGTERLSVQINDMIDYINSDSLFSKDDSMKVTDIPMIVEDVKSKLHINFIRVTSEIKYDEMRISISKADMEVIIFEIVENAKKFNASDIEILISVKSGTELVLEFANNGDPIPVEQMNSVWNPYFQAEKNFTGQIKGMGLGLATVATLVWNKGGICNISNRDDGYGVIVRLEFLIDEKSAKEQSSEHLYAH